MTEFVKKKTRHDKLTDNVFVADERNYKIASSIIDHVYSQINVAIMASLFCASIIAIGLYDPNGTNHGLFVWMGVFVAITLFRFGIYLFYKSSKHTVSSLKGWGALYVLGCFLGGSIWGMLSVIFFPFANSAQQVLMILMMAGVSAGSVPLSAAIPRAGIIFLASSLLPLIISIFVFRNATYYFFDMAVVAYFVYTIILTFKTYRLILNAIVLKYENDMLLNNLAISNKLLEAAATHDPLTNLSNRRLFQKNLEDTIRRAEFKKTLFALFYIDLDNFKQANDTYGHDAGDFILKTVTYRLTVYFRKDDIISRLGGDELAVLVEDVSSREALGAMAHKICQIIAIPIEMNNVTLNVTASIGIGIYPEDGKTGEALISCADQCMYYVKEHGGNNFHSMSGIETSQSK